MTFSIYLLTDFSVLSLLDFYIFDCAFELVLQLPLYGFAMLYLLTDFLVLNLSHFYTFDYDLGFVLQLSH